MRDRPTGPTVPRSVVILGAGTMGTGIALSFANAGARVAVTARRQSTLDDARRRLHESLELMARHELVTAEAVELVPARVSMALFEDLDLDVDLVIESVTEDLAAKVDILRRTEAAAPARTVLTTNTSSLSLRALSDALERPQNFAGFHWFNPPEIVALVEVIPGPGTSAQTLRTLVDWASAVRKVPVPISSEIEGFIANRLQYALMREAYALVERGICGLADVDKVMRACLGPRWAGVGPFEAMDLAGLDVHLEVARRLFPSLSNASEPPTLLERLVSQGALGTKTGRGLHGDYDESTIGEARERRIAALVALAAMDEGARSDTAVGRRARGS
jgi:3-hydroxybutyryl-CoA dehydrogenase